MAKLLDLVGVKAASRHTVIPLEIETLLGDLSVVDGPRLYRQPLFPPVASFTVIVRSLPPNTESLTWN
jgi:hypothetical protein